MVVTWQFILTFLVWLPVGVCIYTVISWMVMDEIDSGVGILALGAAFGLGIATSFAPDRTIVWLPFSMAVVTVLAYPFVSESWRKYQLFQIDVEQIETIYERLKVNRGDVYGMMRLSEKLYERGVQHPAIALLDGALRGQPKDLFQNELKLLANWKRDLGTVPLRTETTCVRCGMANGVGVCFCLRCDSEFLLDIVRKRWVGFSAWGLLFAVWGVLAVCFAVAPFVTSDSTAPAVRLGLGIVAVTIALASFGVLIVKGVRG